MHNFKKFIKTVIIFGVFVFAISCFLIGLFLCSETDRYQDGKARDQYAGTRDTIVIGASRSGRGIKSTVLDEKLGTKSYNLSGPHLTMEGRYLLLQDELERNPVNTVIMEISNDSLNITKKGGGLEGAFYYVMRMADFKSTIRSFVKLVHPFKYHKAYFFFMKEGKVALKDLFKGEYRTYNEDVYKEQGYVPYYPNEVIPVDMASLSKKDYKEYYNTRKMDAKIVDENVYYMDKIIELCEEKGIRMILVTTTVSRLKTCMDSNDQDVHDWCEDYASKKGVEYYDMNLLKERDEKFSDEDCFHDYYHLSNVGAPIFSEVLADTLMRIDNGEKKESLFFSSYGEYEATQDYTK